MKLTKEQQNVVEQNMGLVGKVIKDKVNGSGWSYDDLFQIGCIGLCKAAATDKGGGCFSTYAYRLIWNEICDALIRETRRSEKEQLTEEPISLTYRESAGAASEWRMDLQTVLREARRSACPTVRRGIESMLFMAAGYTCREIGERMGTSANVVSAWVSKARKYLQSLDGAPMMRQGRAA